MYKQLKSIFNNVVLFLAVTATFAACADIDGDDRFIPLPDIELPDEDPNDDSPAMVPRVALLEEFTGQLCVNCPTAHATIAALLNQYPDNLVAVGLHAGGDQFSISQAVNPAMGLRTDESEAYAAAAGADRYPSGAINRTSGVLLPDGWAPYVRNAVQQLTPLKLRVTANLTPDGSSLEINTKAIALEPINGNLQLWVTESGIVAPQLQPDGSMMTDYPHNHVFRASVNGHDGEPFTINAKTPLEIKHKIALQPFWKAENLHVVAFVYTAQGGVEQSATCHVASPAPEEE